MTLNGATLSITRGPTAKQIDVTAIPYYAWCNRGTGKMAVWVF